MQTSPADVAEAHARLGRVDELLAQRRVLYATAVELSQPGAGPAQGGDVLDNPVVRGHLGEVLGGRAPMSECRLRPVSELVAPGFATEIGGHPVRLASAPAATDALAGALRRITAELRRHDDENGGPQLLTTRRPEELATAYEHLVAGVQLAVHAAPALALDLLPHVGLFAVAADPSGRLGSASAREFPGLVLLPEPRAAVEVAEALVHEGAHQKFFDLAMTRAIFGPGSFDAPTFRPSWARAGAPPWPLEQAFAAWHAYRCLDVLSRSLPAGVVRHEGSLLPRADGRAGEIGRWLRGHGPFLGPDAHVLLEVLDGARPARGPAEDDAGTPSLEHLARIPGALLRPAGSRTLVAIGGAPPDLRWVRGSTP